MIGIFFNGNFGILCLILWRNNYLSEFCTIFFLRLKTAISRGFVKRNPLGDLWKEIPWKSGGFRFTNPPLQIPRSKSPAPNPPLLDIFQSKKNMYKIRIFSRWFSPRSPRPSGIWKSPRARHRALGPPLRPPFGAPMGEGIWGKITAKKYEFCTYFFYFQKYLNSEMMN